MKNLIKIAVIIAVALSFGSCDPNSPTCCLYLTSPNEVGIDSLPWDIEHTIDITEDSVRYEMFFDGPEICSDYDDISSEFDLLFYWTGDKKCLVDRNGNRAKYNFNLEIGESKLLSFPNGLFHPNHMNDNTWVWDNTCGQYSFVGLRLKQKSGCFYEETSSTGIAYPPVISDTSLCNSPYPYEEFVPFVWNRHGTVRELTCPVNLTESESKGIREKMLIDILHKEAIQHWRMQPTM